jgi:hypothetical protein
MLVYLYCSHLITGDATAAGELEQLLSRMGFSELVQSVGRLARSDMAILEQLVSRMANLENHHSGK